MRFRIVFILLALIFGSLSLSGPLSAQARQGGGVTIVVENHSFYDMHMYAIQGSQRRSLGMATGISTRSFPLPQQLLESGRDTQILADPVGARRGYLSEFLMLYPGDRVHLILENNLALSRIFIGDPFPEREREDPPEDEEDDEDDEDEPRSGGANPG